MNRSDGGDKRMQIIRAAVKVFSRKGFHEAKVEEIAQLADVGKGTVYEYFSSKSELFQEMFKTGMEFYLNSLTNELKPGLLCREKLERIARLHFRFIIRYRDLAKVTMTEHTYFDEDFRRWIWENRSRKIELLKQIIEEGIARGEFRKVNSRAAAVCFIGSLGASFSPLVINGGKYSYKKLVEPVLDIVLNGLLANDVE